MPHARRAGRPVVLGLRVTRLNCYSGEHFWSELRTMRRVSQTSEACYASFFQSAPLPHFAFPTFFGPDSGLFHNRPGKKNAGRHAQRQEIHMGSKLYVGNLSYNVTSQDLESMFSAHGTVKSAELISDRDTGRSKGFGFVQMGSDDEAQAAISALNGQQHDGRALTVNEAKPRESKPGGGGRSGGGGYGGGGGGGYGGGGGGRKRF